MKRINTAFNNIRGAFEGFAASITALNKAFSAAANATTDYIVSSCPNRRVAHLAKHAKKARTRKKNLHRAIDIMEKGETKE